MYRIYRDPADAFSHTRFWQLRTIQVASEPVEVRTAHRYMKSMCMRPPTSCTRLSEIAYPHICPGSYRPLETMHSPRLFLPLLSKILIHNYIYLCILEGTYLLRITRSSGWTKYDPEKKYDKRKAEATVFPTQPYLQ